MAAPQNFRSAFNGFNREDVVNYISYVTNKHETELNQLRTENDALRQELDALREAGDAQALQQENEELLRKLEQLQQELTARTEQLEDLQTAPAAQPAPESRPDCTDELNAYRRAESAERRAMERVARMYGQANEILASAANGLEHSGADLLRLSEHVQQDLDQFQQAIAASGQVLSDTMTALSALRPEEE